VAQVGKDSAAGRLVERHGFTRLAFADALKDFVYRTDLRIREAVDAFGWESAKILFPWVRQRLQDVGLEARNRFGENVWVDAVFAQMKPGGRYAISDCRFLNEVEAVKARGGIVVRIDRPGYCPVNGHRSEVELLSFSGWDHIVANDGTLEDLAKRVDTMLAEL
jgi:hypothetical protein